MIHIIYSFIDQTNAFSSSWLTDSERHYAADLSEKRQRQFYYGRFLLRKHLASRFMLRSEDINISLPSGQAPLLQVQGKPFQLSISHSVDLIAVAYSETEHIGLDVEYMKPRKNRHALSQQFAALADVADNSSAFYRRWTQCEAYTKFSGQPLLTTLAAKLPVNSPFFYHVPLQQYMLCLCYQRADTQIFTTEVP